MDFGIGETSSPFCNVVEGEVESVENGATDSGGIGVGSAQPGFDVRSRHRGSGHGEEIL
jgi:hypothetical protein